MSGEYFGSDIVADDTNYLEEKRMESAKIGDWSYDIEHEYKNGEAKNVKLQDYVKITPTPNKCRNLIRQNSGAIGTDNTGAAVVTINNILSGITNSINRLSELHSCIDTDKREPVKEQRNLQENDDNDNAVSAGFLCVKSSSLVNNKKREPKRSKKKSFTSFESSSSFIHSRNKSRFRYMSKEDTNKGPSSTSMKKRRVKRLKQLSKTSVVKKNTKLPSKHAGYPANHLVEIYHNTAARSSESDDNIEPQPVYNKKSLNSENKMKPMKPAPAMPSSHSTGTDKIPEVHCPSRRQENNRSLSPIQEQRLDLIDTNCETNFDTDFTAFTHNYETPTIASRMKQVAKSYFRQINSKTIPFCVATSTSPSHNIGINIQQVLNIIKTKQPIKGISPTLAHNIGIAAQKLNHESLSILVSSFGSKVGYTNNYVPCPMIKNSVNYQELQEMAKNEIEEVQEDPQEEQRDQVEQGNLEQKPLNTVWAVDPNTQMNCTCIPRQGVGFQQILNRYQQLPMYQSSNNQYSQHIMKKSKQKYKHVKSVYAQYNDTLRRKSDYSEEMCNNNPSGEGSMNLKGKEKVLKGVLMNLHEEFKQMNDRYDELSKTMNAGGDSEVSPSDVKELERLEKKLNDKEEEIQMVMSLYTEVVNLKQQVKALREKASMASMMVEQQKQQYQMAAQHQYYQQYQQYQQYNYQQLQQNQPPKRRSSSGTAVAAHLNKLLRQIKNLQGFQ